MFEHVRDMVVPDSTSITTASIIKALAPKYDGEDPLDIAMHR
jgi:hypothetical protein